MEKDSGKRKMEGTVRSQKEDVFDSRTNWPPYTYRDYPDINPETYRSFMEFLSTENTSNKVMELQAWISFCSSKCTFCFYPTNPYNENKIENYLRALKKELKMYSETKYIKTSEFDEIVLGGGTPSVLTAEQMIDLISYCEENYNTTEGYFIKTSGATHTFDEKKLSALAEYGVYQIDMGAQTFNNKIRKMLNLPDSAEHAAKIIEKAGELAPCVCIDIMYNIPGQSMESWVQTVKKVIELDVEVDCYALNITPGTILDKQLKSGQVPPQGDAEKEERMYQKAYELFTEAGYTPVGHDRFSRDEWHVNENCLNQWPWAGILTTGAGCIMGYLQRYSYANVESSGEYIETVLKGRFPISNLSWSTDEDMMRKVMTKLYLRLPVDKLKFQEHFGKIPEEVFPDKIKKLQKKGLVEVDDKKIRLTKLGDLWRANIAWEFTSDQ